MQRTGEIASRGYWQLYPLKAGGKGSEWKLEGREIIIKKRKYANIRMEESARPNGQKILRGGGGPFLSNL